MNNIKITALAITMMLLLANAYGDDISATDLIKKVVNAYKSAKTYKSEGTVTTKIDSKGMKMETKTEFSILMKKPNMYLISWQQGNKLMPALQTGAVWNDGTAPYLYMGIMHAYSKMNSDMIAISTATGISSGAAFTIPSLFLTAFKGTPTPFSRLVDPKIIKSEKMCDEDCFVLTSSSTISKEETFWISKKTYFIRRYRRSLETSENNTKTPEITDEEIEKTLKSMGVKVTEESKKNTRKMMMNAKEMLKKAKLKGYFDEIYTKISSPELDKKDFKFSLPEGAVLKDSLFNGMLNQNLKTLNTKAQ